ncbi:MAG: hypothetical protein IJ371_06020 [Clostridia bacterium]|nr:hypothetical protein [Clostridia bacterium]
MLDKKTTAVLKVLGRLGEDCAYKVVTVEEILSSLNSRNQYDADSVKQIIEYLCKQEYIVLKFEEDVTFCYSLLPKARIYLEQDSVKVKAKKQHLPYGWLFLCLLMSGVGSFVANLLFYYFLG